MRDTQFQLRPAEIMTSERAKSRVLVFECEDGTYMLAFQRHETEMAGSFYVDRWADIGTVELKVRLNIEASYLRGITDWTEAMIRAATVLAQVAVYTWVHDMDGPECPCCVDNECECVRR